MAFTTGDKVRLKSGGGPVMTVDNVVEEQVSVNWTDAEGCEQQEEYQAEMLKVTEARDL